MAQVHSQSSLLFPASTSQTATHQPTRPLSTTKSRIVNHMNTSHRHSLSLFLQHYCNVPASAVSSPTSIALETISLNHQILVHCSENGAPKQRYYIPFKPPMISFSETRSRMKSIHEESLRGLNLSDVKLDIFLPPRRVTERGTFVIVALTMLAFCRGGNFQPGAYFYETFGLGRVPWFASFCTVIQPYLIAGMLFIHITEAVYFSRTRLRRHQVRMGSRLWWQWVANCFIEGIFCFWRFDAWSTEMEGKESTQRKQANKRQH